MYRGFYINPDRNQKRRESVTRNLADVGLSDVYQRVPALDGPARVAEKQDLLAHEQLLKSNRDSNSHLHVIEDDALLPADARRCLSDMLDKADKHLKSWDLIFTEASLPLEVSCFQLLSQAREQYQQSRALNFFPVKHLPGFTGASSIFINRNSIDKYLNLIAAERAKGMTIDFYRAIVKDPSVHAYLTMPFLTSFSPDVDEPDSRKKPDRSSQVLNLYRLAAYKDANIPHLAAQMRQLPANPDTPVHAELFLDAVKFLLSDRYVNF